jgi:hypothetical protein
MTLRVRSFQLVLGSVLALFAGCASDAVDQRKAPLGSQTSGPGGTPGGDDCAAILDQDCDPSEKQYTEAEIAACEAQRQDAYDVCVVVAACNAAFATGEAACGAKPPENTPERDVFDACYAALQAQLNTCIGDVNGDAP